MEILYLKELLVVLLLVLFVLIFTYKLVKMILVDLIKLIKIVFIKEDFSFSKAYKEMKKNCKKEPKFDE